MALIELSGNRQSGVSISMQGGLDVLIKLSCLRPTQKNGTKSAVRFEEWNFPKSFSSAPKETNETTIGLCFEGSIQVPVSTWEVFQGRISHVGFACWASLVRQGQRVIQFLKACRSSLHQKSNYKREGKVGAVNPQYRDVGKILTFKMKEEVTYKLM